MNNTSRDRMVFCYHFRKYAGYHYRVIVGFDYQPEAQLAKQDLPRKPPMIDEIVETGEFALTPIGNRYVVMQAFMNGP